PGENQPRLSTRNQGRRRSVRIGRVGGLNKVTPLNDQDLLPKIRSASQVQGQSAVSLLDKVSTEIQRHSVFIKLHHGERESHRSRGNHILHGGSRLVNRNRVGFHGRSEFNSILGRVPERDENLVVKRNHDIT